MIKVLTSLAILLTLAAALFGYLNHQRYEAILVGKNKMMSDQQSLSAALRGELALARGELAAQAMEVAKNKSDLIAAQQVQQTVMNNLAILQKQLADATAMIAQQKKDLIARDASIQNFQQQIKQLQEVPVSLSSKESETKKELEEVSAKLKAAQEKIQEFKQRELDHKKKFSNGGLEGKVLAVNPTWKFIVINLGDQNGVIKGSEMLIKRDAQLIAKVKITSVEPLTSIADIIPETVISGFFIQPSDVVIYTGPENSK
ncbi:MAG: hypothetical protein ACH346_02590 [Chthoniobacterales bacterium]